MYVIVLIRNMDIYCIICLIKEFLGGSLNI